MRSLTLNERRLLELVFRRGRVARVELAAKADLTGASVTRLVSGLIDEKLVEETVLKDGARGQPKKLLSLRREGFCSAGFYLFAGHISAVLMDFSGNVLEKREIASAARTARQLVDIIRSTTREFLSTPALRTKTFVGVGLGLPGNFGSFESHLKAHESFPELDGGAIQNVLASETEWDIFLENDGTAVALGEFLFGGHDVESLFLLHIGYGLGGGAVLNGRPYRGSRGNACLPGALFPYNGPRPTLLDFEQHVGLSGRSFIAAEKLGELRKEDGEKIDQWIERASSQLEIAVRIVSGLYDPEVIVLGGALPASIISKITLNLAERNIEGPSRGLRNAPVCATSLGNMNGPVGAASIPFFNCFFPGSTARN